MAALLHTAALLGTVIFGAGGVTNTAPQVPVVITSPEVAGLDYPNDGTDASLSGTTTTLTVSPGVYSGSVITRSYCWHTVAAQATCLGTGTSLTITNSTYAGQALEVSETVSGLAGNLTTRSYWFGPIETAIPTPPPAWESGGTPPTTQPAEPTNWLACYGPGTIQHAVFPGSAVPPCAPTYTSSTGGPTTHTWYFDPINGHTVSAGATGSKANPFNNIQALLRSDQSGYPHALFGNTAVNPSAIIVPGDTIYLEPGWTASNGQIVGGTAPVVGFSTSDGTSTGAVIFTWIMPDPTATSPVILSNIAMGSFDSGAVGWIFHGSTTNQLNIEGGGGISLGIESGAGTGATHDMVFEGMSINGWTGHSGDTWVGSHYPTTGGFADGTQQTATPVISGENNAYAAIGQPAAAGSTSLVLTGIPVGQPGNLVVGEYVWMGGLYGTAQPPATFGTAGGANGLPGGTKVTGLNTLTSYVYSTSNPTLNAITLTEALTAYNATGDTPVAGSPFASVAAMNAVTGAPGNYAVVQPNTTTSQQTVYAWSSTLSAWVGLAVIAPPCSSGCTATNLYNVLGGSAAITVSSISSGTMTLPSTTAVTANGTITYGSPLALNMASITCSGTCTPISPGSGTLILNTSATLAAGQTIVGQYNTGNGYYNYYGFPTVTVTTGGTGTSFAVKTTGTFSLTSSAGNVNAQNIATVTTGGLGTTFSVTPMNLALGSSTSATYTSTWENASQVFNPRIAEWTGLAWSDLGQPTISLAACNPSTDSSTGCTTTPIGCDPIYGYSDFGGPGPFGGCNGSGSSGNPTSNPWNGTTQNIQPNLIGGNKTLTSNIQFSDAEQILPQGYWNVVDWGNAGRGIFSQGAFTAPNIMSGVSNLSFKDNIIRNKTNGLQIFNTNNSMVYNNKFKFMSVDAMDNYSNNRIWWFHNFYSDPTVVWGHQDCIQFAFEGAQSSIALTYNIAAVDNECWQATDSTNPFPRYLQDLSNTQLIHMYEYMADNIVDGTTNAIGIIGNYAVGVHNTHISRGVEVAQALGLNNNPAFNISMNNIGAQILTVGPNSTMGDGSCSKTGNNTITGGNIAPPFITYTNTFGTAAGSFCTLTATFAASTTSPGAYGAMNATAAGNATNTSLPAGGLLQWSASDYRNNQSGVSPLFTAYDPLSWSAYPYPINANLVATAPTINGAQGTSESCIQNSFPETGNCAQGSTAAGVVNLRPNPSYTYNVPTNYAPMYGYLSNGSGSAGTTLTITSPSAQAPSAGVPLYNGQVVNGAGFPGCPSSCPTIVASLPVGGQPFSTTYTLSASGLVGSAASPVSLQISSLCTSSTNTISYMPGPSQNLGGITPGSGNPLAITSASASNLQGIWRYCTAASASINGSHNVEWEYVTPIYTPGIVGAGTALTAWPNGPQPIADHDGLPWANPPSAGAYEAPAVGSVALCLPGMPSMCPGGLN